MKTLNIFPMIAALAFLSGCTRNCDDCDDRAEMRCRGCDHSAINNCPECVPAPPPIVVQAPRPLPPKPIQAVPQKPIVRAVEVRSVPAPRRMRTGEISVED